MIYVGGLPFVSPSSSASPLQEYATLVALLEHPVLVSASNSFKEISELKVSINDVQADSSYKQKHVYVFQKEYATVDPAHVDMRQLRVWDLYCNPKDGITSAAHLDSPKVVVSGLNCMLSSFNNGIDMELDVHLVGGYEDSPFEEVDQSGGSGVRKRVGCSWALCCEIIKALLNSATLFHIRTLCILAHNTWRDNCGTSRPIANGLLFVAMKIKELFLLCSMGGTYLFSLEVLKVSLALGNEEIKYFTASPSVAKNAVILHFISFDAIVVLYQFVKSIEASESAPLEYEVTHKVETSTGLIRPACFDRSSRIPDEIVRRIRVSFSFDDPAWNGRLLETYDAHEDKFSIAPCRWDRNWKYHALEVLQFSDLEVLQYCSTSPDAENPEFVENIRREYRYLVKNPDWRKIFPLGKPRVFKRTVNGGWTRSE